MFVLFKISEKTSSKELEVACLSVEEGLDPSETGMNAVLILPDGRMIGPKWRVDQLKLIDHDGDESCLVEHLCNDFDKVMPGDNHQLLGAWCTPNSGAYYAAFMDQHGEQIWLYNGPDKGFLAHKRVPKIISKIRKIRQFNGEYSPVKEVTIIQGETGTIQADVVTCIGRYGSYSSLYQYRRIKENTRRGAVSAMEHVLLHRDKRIPIEKAVQEAMNGLIQTGGENAIRFWN